MKTAIVAIALSVASFAVAAMPVMATHTGRSEYVETVGYSRATNCEYRVSTTGQTFWKLYPGMTTCPFSITVY